ncbi:hypothetical protein [Azospirillum sp. TSO22-1]|uniref:hypothetical protein n=1 Tax=Azospirillum sp. TSO22-1 TaxID=716789 RepID=UPI000D6210A7|nr:hypothetical protein [Azospirillum sp. TSO22-1]PWC43844.1 hypothetical protein TSO221_19015 [Azospirillum sp. TSO22-1]
MHRSLIAGLSLLVLAAAAGCAQDNSMPTTNAGSAGFGRTDAACPPGNVSPECTSSSRLGPSGTGRADRGDATMYGTSDNPAFGVQP